MVTKKFQTSELQQINLLTIQEVADWAKVSTKTINRWISDNKIPIIRLGNRTYRIPENAINDYLNQNGYGHLLPWSFALAWSEIARKLVSKSSSFSTHWY